MQSVYVPTGEASAALSQLTSSKMDLQRFEGLNGAPGDYFRALFIADALDLSDDPRVIRRLRIMESFGVSVAMTGADTLNRMASVLPNESNRIWTRPISNTLDVTVQSVEEIEDLDTANSGDGEGARARPAPIRSRALPLNPLEAWTSDV